MAKYMASEVRLAHSGGWRGGGGVAPDGVQRRKEAGLPCVKEASMAKYMASEVRVAHSGGGGGGGRIVFTWPSCSSHSHCLCSC